jgi:hypothetical protein
MGTVLFLIGLDPELDPLPLPYGTIFRTRILLNSPNLRSTQSNISNTMTGAEMLKFS